MESIRATPWHLHNATRERYPLVAFFSLEIARAISYALTQAVAYTHSKDYVHGGLS
jgi:hypothetical protein